MSEPAGFGSNSEKEDGMFENNLVSEPAGFGSNFDLSEEPAGFSREDDYQSLVCHSRKSRVGH